MIIVRLSGGLGNQMFQYALGRRLSQQLQATLKLDLSILTHTPNRSYSLHHFNVIENIASEKEIYRFSGVPQTLFQKITHRIKKHMPFTYNIFYNLTKVSKKKHVDNHFIVYSEPHFHFDPNVLKLCGNIYLRGYWQSEKYFKDIKNIIYEEFTIKKPLKGRNLELARQIENCNSVCLHFRRGDYVTSPKWRVTHGVCSINYYRAAIQILKSHVSNPHFFIFSDDPGWVKNNFEFSDPKTVVDHNSPEKNYEDLRLMGLCQNHIIANSTFSWWGAWLALRKNGLVIAPKKWFGEERMGKRVMDDLYAEGWRVI
jgi:hypothetical protein